MRQLSIDEIKTVLFGSAETEITEEGIRPHKCTKRQIAVWAKEREVLGERAYGTTGAVIDFLTNSKKVRFDVTLHKFELLINGTLVYQLAPDEEPKHSIEWELDGSENRVTLVFPNHRNGVLRAIFTEDGATVTPYPYERKILFLGDSITQGWNSVYETDSFAHRVSEALNAERHINGIGGAYFLSESFEDIGFKPDLTVIAYGTNDFGHYPTLAAFTEQCEGFFRKVKETYGDKPVFVAVPIWRSDEATPKKMGTFRECRDVIFRAVEKFGFIPVDGYTLVPHLDLFYADAVHPNDLGFASYAENLLKAIHKEGIA